MAGEVKKLSQDEYPGGRGAKIGGKAAATRAASAAAMAKILSGIHFPKKKEEMVAYARKDKRNLDNPEKVLETIDEIPNRAYYTIVEVEKAIGKLR